MQIGPTPDPLEIEANKNNYMVATFDSIDVFFHEAMWVINNKRPIPDYKLVFHIDGNPLNNNAYNLELVDENKEYGDLHLDENKIFHESNIDKYEELIKLHFPDIYNVIFNINNRITEYK